LIYFNLTARTLFVRDLSANKGILSR